MKYKTNTIQYIKRQFAFLLCVIVLAISSGGMSLVTKKFELYLKKEPLPLKKTFELLDENGLSPYVVISKEKIKNKEILKELGTKDYIQWIIEDSEEQTNSPVHTFLLFLTYYQLPDRVPHVPEECYMGGGFQKTKSDNVIFDIGNSDIKTKVPGKYLLFEKKSFTIWRGIKKFPVLYFFKVNGLYANSRGEARSALNRNIFGKHSYFCKIEIIFNQKINTPNKEEAVKACQKILNVVLPLLEKEHWPEWEEN